MQTLTITHTHFSNNRSSNLRWVTPEESAKNKTASPSAPTVFSISDVKDRDWVCLDEDGVAAFKNFHEKLSKCRIKIAAAVKRRKLATTKKKKKTAAKKNAKPTKK